MSCISYEMDGLRLKNARSGFAIPSDMAKSVMDSIIRSGKVIRGWLGVSIQDTPDLAAAQGVSVQELTRGFRQRLHIPDSVNGVVVTGISPELGGQGLLMPNDVIQEVNRAAIRNVQDYDRAISKIGEKDNVLLLIYRGGGSLYVTIRPK